MLEQLGTYNRTKLEVLCQEHVQPKDVDENVAIIRALMSYNLFVDKDDESLGKHLIKDGYWEMWITQFILQRLRPGMVTIDVGANFGYYTFMFAEMVGEYGQVYAFEPQPSLLEHLKNGAEINNYKNISIVSGVAGEESGWTELMIPTKYRGAASMAVEPGVEYFVEPDVSVYTIDEMVFEADFVKIDAEGAEEKIWNGMQTFLDNNPDVQIVLEFTPEGYKNPLKFLERMQERFLITEISTDATAMEISVDALLKNQNTYLYLANDYPYSSRNSDSVLGYYS